ncbi:hypothetical protein N7533_011307 [Penicillium manginii]|uniref:uncharacterized protein n=1 Tax=Penicillium manginii TaxID=203109 RepID=UPI00254783DF|nr:uncharacterized protein N7533_011307 [Penicillium manginii]KAJ5741898.1 hypothetical protein N7533_011307 [Penicillium manginii]
MPSMEPVAIISTACRFAGSSSSPSKLWELLENPRDVASQPPADRFNINAFYDPEGSNPSTTNAREGYFLSDNVRAFDAPFFNISATEALALDPQQRMLLEVVYESLETAGQRLDTLRGSSTGVYCGVMNSDWEGIFSVSCSAPQYGSVGVARNNLANRISYFFDWQGPSMSIDTACSASMVALHEAVTALNRGDCSLVAALGANLMLSPSMYIAASNLQMLSPNSRGRMWDAKADGYARGEGVASVLMKRLSDAIADGDPIECVIRATGVNHDGRSMGFTMPSSAAQLKLIQSTYAQAGLDPQRPEDRPQYVEAHGTGTLAGDPQEASALHQAFFDSDENDSVLHVGSIKTVVGHAEGTAGLAGIIKASQSIQRGIITPNLLFDSLNPDLEPYARQLRVPVDVLEWPTLAPGVPRRVSVNSFGFGGTNAHVILEGYESPRSVSSVEMNLGSQEACLPIVFSAESDYTLGAVLEQYSHYMHLCPDVSIHDLAWTLLERRTALTHRVILWAQDLPQLQKVIEAELALRKAGHASTIISRSRANTRKHILGVFTGQGAQWAQMGFNLITTSSTVQVWLSELQESLDTLPEPYRPKFSLFEELAAGTETSRLQDALFSQTLCTAMQIIWIKLLWELNVHLDAVVGHSSGEIAAAFAAGYLTAADAIRVAYLRGVFCSNSGYQREGAMLAVGLSMNEATLLCKEVSSLSSGQINVAASNSPESVTLSGDREAILLADQQLKDRGVFCRLLRVSTAYHSHHMQACAQPYLDGLRSCNIQVQAPTSTTWYSSVHGGQPVDGTTVMQDITGEYWVENLTSPVLFSQALTAAISATKPSLIVEIGPHPALKGPSLQTIAGLESTQVPYTGVSARGVGALESMAGAIGEIWAQIGPQAINPRQYMAVLHPQVPLSVVAGLPLYPFDHRTEYGYETRKANGWLHKRNSPHPLLGSLSEDLGDGELRWAQNLSPSRVSWLDGHRVQGQIIVPATAYISMALEAVRILATEKHMSLQLVQIERLVIGQALSFQDERDEIEILFDVPRMEKAGNNTSVGYFRCQVSTPKGDVKTCAEASVEDLEGYYRSLRDIGYQYTGDFQGIHSLSRKMGIATGQLHNPALQGLLVHPAVLDTGLQGLLAAMGEGYLTALHVPTRIEAVTINPVAFTGSSLDFEAVVTRTGADGLVGDVELYTAINGPGAVFFEGVHVSPLSPPSAADDPPVFWVQRWTPLKLDANRSNSQLTPEWMARLEVYEHRAFLVLKDLLDQITPSLRAGFDWHRERVVAWIEHLVEEARVGRHAVCKTEWLSDRLADLEPTWTLPGAIIEDQIMHRVHQNLIPFLHGEAQMIDALREDELLTRFYRDELELQDVNRRVGELVGDLAVRYPRMKLLEVGAGTASATREVLRHVGRAYHSYTFTDISAGFFEDTLDSLPDHADRLIFQKLDVGQDPVDQGFEEHAYDVIIAANVLHATPSLEQTLRNVRKLLKPGGYLVALEITNLHTIRIGLLMSAFDGWWLGHEDGRPWGPMVSASRWNDLLLETGFGGIETVSDRAPGDLTMYSVFAAQAVDDQISNLRKPLSPSLTLPPFERGVIVGGSSDRVADITALISPFFATIEYYPSIDSLAEGPRAVVLVLVDLDGEACFQDLTESRLAGLQTLVRIADKTLPHLGLSKGFLTCMNYEHAPAMFQYLNIIDPAKAQPKMLAEHLLRLGFTTQVNDFALSNCLHSTELELRMDRDGNFLFPRINVSDDLNTRYAAARRPVVQSIEDIHREVVAVDQAPDGQLRLCLADEVRTKIDESIIDVRYSTSRALRINSGGYLILVLGKDRVTKTRLVALTDRLASVISSACFWEVPDHVSTEQESEYLHATASSLLAATLFKPSDNVVLMHGADDDTLRRAIAIQAAAQTITPVFTTTNMSSIGPGRSIRVHENDPLRTLARRLPRNVSNIVNLDPNADRLFGRLISAVGSPGISKEHILGTLTETCGRKSVSQSAIQVQGLIETLRKAAVTAEQLVAQSPSSPPLVVPIADLPSSAMDLVVVDWATSTSKSVQAHIKAESSLVRLSPRKTYLLVGMTSALGQSITQWLISCGARNVILTSRNPQIDPAWIAELYHTTGARVEVMSMDVTKRASVFSLSQRLKSDWPPLGGVVNGAMVLWDRLFVDADLPLLAGQLAPKVQGSLLLDEIFGEEPTLDFFILFGSAVATIGNLGQSAYTAASNFLLGLAARRRSRGLVASVVQPAQVTGDIGYLSGKGDAFWNRMFDMLGDHPVSEQDLHELFAHAILTGRGSESYPAGLGSANADDDIVLGGIRIQDPAVHPDILWFRTPKVWPFIRYHHQGDGPSASSGTAMPLAQRLVSATTMTQVGEIVEEVVTAKLHHRLHLPGEVGDGSVAGDTRLTELGVDSLIAVDLRRWFAQELEVDIPVLQLLGGCSVRELAEMTSGLLDKKFFPGVVIESVSEAGDKSECSGDGHYAGSLSSSSYQALTPPPGGSD